MIYFINPCHIIPSATYSGFHTLTSVSIRQICLHCCSFSPLSSPFYILFPGTFSLYCQPRSAIRYFHPLAIPHYGACVFFSFLHDATSFKHLRLLASLATPATMIVYFSSHFHYRLVHLFTTPVHTSVMSNLPCHTPLTTTIPSVLYGPTTRYHLT